MSGKYLLDTNIVIALFADESDVVGKIRKMEKIFIPSIVIGELYYGVEKSSRAKENCERIKEFSSDNAVLNCDKETAGFYGKIKNGLRKKGRPIPENDIWIAAIAFQYNLTLITRDEHFKEIEDLKMIICF